jgi:hypothetical protein
MSDQELVLEQVTTSRTGDPFDLRLYGHSRAGDQETRRPTRTIVRIRTEGIGTVYRMQPGFVTPRCASQSAAATSRIAHLLAIRRECPSARIMAGGRAERSEVSLLPASPLAESLEAAATYVIEGSSPYGAAAGW